MVGVGGLEKEGWERVRGAGREGIETLANSV